jgi:hypothetical protein
MCRFYNCNNLIFGFYILNTVCSSLISWVGAAYGLLVTCSQVRIRGTDAFSLDYELVENSTSSIITILHRGARKVGGYLQRKCVRNSTEMAAWSSGKRVRITSRMGSNPVRGKSLFPWARNFTLIAQYWLVPGTDSTVCVYKLMTTNTVELK